MSVSLFTGPNSILGRLKEVSTRSAFHRPKDVYSINKAYEMKQKGEKNFDPQDLTTFQKFLRKIKVGHLAGIGTAGLFGGLDVLRRLAEKKKKKGAAALTAVFESYTFFGLLAGVGSFVSACLFKNRHEESIKGELDGIVERTLVKADGSAELVKEKVPDDKAYPTLDQVVLPPNSQDKLYKALALAEDQKRGSVYCFRGITRCGKTMTTRAIARDLAQKSKTGKAQYWYASEETMKDNFMDHIPGFGKEILGKILGIKATTEKLEKLFAHALLEEDPVVIVLDEAHKLLGFGGDRYNPNNPHHNSQLIDSLKRLFSEKLKTKKCNNVYLFLPSNSAGTDIAAPMKERMDVDLFYDKLKEPERKKLIKNILESEINNKADRIDIKIEDFDDEDFDKLGTIGTCNLLEKFGKDETTAHDEAVRAGFGGKVEELRERPMLNGEAIEKTVKGSIVEYVNGGCKGGKDKLINSIEESLQRLLDSILEQRREWESELKTYLGGSSSSLPITLRRAG